MEDCEAFFASHGCDLPKRHDGPHRCFHDEERPPDEGGWCFEGWAWEQGDPRGFGRHN